MINKIINIIVAIGLSIFSTAQVGTYFVSTVAGNGQPGYSGDGGLAINSQINSPYEIVTDDNNNVYFVDQLNKSIRKIDAQTKIISTIVDSTNQTINNINFNPNYIEYANYAIYFNDGTSRLFKYDLSLNSVSLVYDFTQNGTSISHFTVKGDSIFYTTIVTGTSQIDLLYNVSINPIIIPDYSSPNVSSTYQYNNYAIITDLLIDNNGDLLILNNGLSSKEVVRLNHTNYQAEVVFNTTSLLSLPEGFAVDSNNDIYIVDQTNNQIFIYKNNTLSVFAGTGASGDLDAIANLSTFNAPVKLAVDNNNIIYVSDNNNHKIREISEDCTPAYKPNLALSTINYADCPDNVIINVINPDTNLNDNTDWVWYLGGCGVNEVYLGSTITIDAHEPVNLYVRGEGGCSKNGACELLDFKGLDCTPNYTLTDIVTAFSPKNDGVNDTWFIDGIQANTSVYIYNRWGDLIKRIDKYENDTNAWDGKSSLGELVPEGTYFYVLENNNKKVARGWVQVLH